MCCQIDCPWQLGFFLTQGELANLANVPWSALHCLDEGCPENEPAVDMLKYSIRRGPYVDSAQHVRVQVRNPWEESHEVQNGDNQWLHKRPWSNKIERSKAVSWNKRHAEIHPHRKTCIQKYKQRNTATATCANTYTLTIKYVLHCHISIPMWWLQDCQMDFYIHIIALLYIKFTQLSCFVIQAC